MKKIFILSIYVFSLLACNSSKEKPTPDDTQIKKEATVNIETQTPVIEKTTKVDSIIQKAKEVVIEDKEVPVKEVEANEKAIVKEKKQSEIENKPAIEEKKVTPEKVEEIVEKVIPEVVPKVEKIKTALKPKHDIWNALTKNYVSANGRVKYKSLKTQLPKIETYLKELENTPPEKDWSRNEKLAYWFNLYNAATVHLIASNYPVKSIKDINGGKPWDKKFIKSGTNIYSLNEIENTIVRPHYNEPRIHLGFNCAAISCPNLLNEAFTANKLNSQLNSLSKKWINDTTKNKISENEIQISKIFEWYTVDFKKGVIPFINTYSSTKVAENSKISYLEYNWKLNE